jgi:hypothetical protein
MKKTFTLLSMLLAGSFAFAQSPRLVMVEAFSQASCAPCASQNPALNAALDAVGTGTAVSVKYQTDWPGYDPMNEQNPSEVQTRVTYYNVSGVPARKLDGNQGTSITTATIGTRQAVTSPFSLGVNHVFNADKSAATVNITLTASQAFSASGSLVLHVAMVEKEIDFETAPGSNGETVFHSVMRKMIPNASGSALPATWTNGQSQTFTLQINTPNYIYKVGEIAFVAWVQDNGSKEVHQAGYSAPQPVASSASVTSLTGVPVFQCTNTFTPSIVIKNTGTSTLTSGTVKYQIDANPEQSLPWTGSLAPGATATQALPTVTSSAGVHTFKTYLSNPNGTPLFTTIHDAKQKQFTIIGSTGIVSPIYENYVLPTFPPASWFLTNPDNSYTWERSAAAGAIGTAQSAKMNFYNSGAGNVDELFLPTTNLTLSTSQASLDFYVAYATYQTEQDKLEVKVSTDCGATWTTPFSKAGTALQTANPQTTAFTPTAAQWRLESVDMTPFLNQTKVMVKFVGTSAYGNNLYVDEINLHSGPPSPLAVKDINAINTFEVYPNPFENQTTLNINTTKSERISFDVVDMLGNRVMTQDLGVVNGFYRQNIDATSWNAGIYFININSSEGGSITKKINVIK